MGRYRIRVATGAWLFSGSHNRVQLWLVGVRGESELEVQLRPARGQVSRGSWVPDPGSPGSGPGRARGGRRQLRLQTFWAGVWGRQSAPLLAGERIRAQGRAGLNSLLPPRDHGPQQPLLLPQLTTGQCHYGISGQRGRSSESTGAARAQFMDGCR